MPDLPQRRWRDVSAAKGGGRVQSPGPGEVTSSGISSFHDLPRPSRVTQATSSPVLAGGMGDDLTPAECCHPSCAPGQATRDKGQARALSGGPPGVQWSTREAGSCTKAGIPGGRKQAGRQGHCVPRPQERGREARGTAMDTLAHMGAPSVLLASLAPDLTPAQPGGGVGAHNRIMGAVTRQ